MQWNCVVNFVQNCFFLLYRISLFVFFVSELRLSFTMKTLTMIVDMEKWEWLKSESDEDRRWAAWIPFIGRALTGQKWKWRVRNVMEETSFSNHPREWVRFDTTINCFFQWNWHAETPPRHTYSAQRKRRVQISSPITVYSNHHLARLKCEIL